MTRRAVTPPRSVSAGGKTTKTNSLPEQLWERFPDIPTSPEMAEEHLTAGTESAAISEDPSLAQVPMMALEGQGKTRGEMILALPNLFFM